MKRHESSQSIQGFAIKIDFGVTFTHFESTYLHMYLSVIRVKMQKTSVRKHLYPIFLTMKIGVRTDIYYTV